MNNEYLAQLIKEETKELEDFLSHALGTINLSKAGPLANLSVVELKGYPQVLKVQFAYNKTAYINIHCNSIKATAGQLFNYIYHGSNSCMGFIKEEY